MKITISASKSAKNVISFCAEDCIRDNGGMCNIRENIDIFQSD